MAGGKKQKVTGFTQAEQELLAVSGKIFHGFEIQNREKFLRPISGILVNFPWEEK